MLQINLAMQFCLKAVRQKWLGNVFDVQGGKNNCLAVLEYRNALATLRMCSQEADGVNNRRLKICGDKGTLELCPLERFDGQPLKLRMTLAVRATALNRADLMQRAGDYPSPPGWPEWMGLEVAGIILEAPAQSRWKPGDSVCALIGGGGYAEKVAVPADMVVPVPEGLSMAEAASLPEVFATAYLNIMVEGGMQAGDTVLIQGGAELGRCIETLAPGGRWIVIATLGGARTELDVNLFFRRGYKLIGSTLRSRSSAMKAKILAELEAKVWPLVSSGIIKPVVYKVLPVTEADAAHVLLQQRENLGKVVLTVKEA